MLALTEYFWSEVTVVQELQWKTKSYPGVVDSHSQLNWSWTICLYHCHFSVLHLTWITSANLIFTIFLRNIAFNSLCQAVLDWNALDLFHNFWGVSQLYMLHWDKNGHNCLSRNKASTSVKDHSESSTRNKTHHVYCGCTEPQIPTDLNFPWHDYWLQLTLY